MAVKRTKKKKQLSRIWPPLVTLVLLLVVGGSLYALHKTNKDQPVASTGGVRPTNSVNYNPPTSQDEAAVNQNKQAIVASTKSSSEGSSTSNPSQASDSMSVFITGYTDATASQPLTVRTLVEGTTSGTCVFTFSQNGTSFNKDFPITFQATSASCENVSIPASAFPASGNWVMSIVAKNGNSASPAVTQTIEVTE